MILLRLVLAICLMFQLSSQLSRAHGDSGEEFKRAVQNLRRILDGKQIESIGRLRHAILDANGGFNVQSPSQNLPRKAIEKGIGNVVKAYEHHIENNKKGKAKFEEAFQKLVVNPCDSVLREMRPIKKAYNSLLRDQNKARELDMDSLEWLVNTRICFDIFTTKSEIEHAALEVAIGGHYHRTPIGRALHKVHLLRRRSLGRGELSDY